MVVAVPVVPVPMPFAYHVSNKLREHRNKKKCVHVKDIRLSGLLTIVAIFVDFFIHWIFMDCFILHLLPFYAPRTYSMP